MPPAAAYSGGSAGPVSGQRSLSPFAARVSPASDVVVWLRGWGEGCREDAGFGGDVGSPVLGVDRGAGNRVEVPVLAFATVVDGFQSRSNEGGAFVPADRAQALVNVRE